MADPNPNEQQQQPENATQQPVTPPKKKNDDSAKFIQKVLKKNKRSESQLDPSKSAKDALKTVTSLTHTIDISNIVDKVLKRTDYSVSKQVAWPDVLNYLERDSGKRNEKTNQLIDDLVNENVSGNITTRKIRYREYRSVIKKLPILNKLLRIYTSNVLSSDDITKISIRIVPVNNVMADDETIKTIIGKYTIILDKVNLEKYVSDVIYNSFFLGDYFIEVQSSKRSLIQTLYNLQLPVVESKSSILRSSPDHLIINRKECNVNSGSSFSSKKMKLVIEESVPLASQIADTASVVQRIMNELFEVPIHGVLTESVITQKLDEDIALKNTIDILKSEMMLSEDDAITLNIKTDDSDDDTKSSNTTDLKHVIDVLPTEASLSNLTLKPISPEEIIVLERDNVCYGYLHITGLPDGTANLTGTGSLSSSSLNTVTNGLETEKASNNAIVMGFVQSLSDYFKEKFGETNPDGSSKFDIEQMAPGIQQLIADILNSNTSAQTEMLVRYIPPSNMQHFKRKGSGMYDPYGESMLDDLMFMSRLLLADNISSTINKISKVGKRMSFVVKGNTQQQAMNNIMDVKAAVSKNSVTIDKLGSIDMIPAAINSQKSFYIPEINGEKQMEIDSIDMGSYSDQNDPGNTMLKQLITSADVPPPFLGFDEYTNSKANLSSENVVFAQNIITAQKEFAEQFTELMQKIYLALYLKTKNFDVAFKQVKFTFNAPRTIMLNVFAENLGYLESVIGTLSKLEIPTDKIIERYYPELVSFDLKLTQTINTLNKGKGNGQGDQDNGGLAPFDSGGGGDLFGGMDLGGGSTPPPPESPAQNSNPDQVLSNMGL